MKNTVRCIVGNVQRGPVVKHFCFSFGKS